MLAWHVPFLGWRRLPDDLSEFEVAHFFTLSPTDRRAIRSRYKRSLRVGAALQLGFLRMSGRPLSVFQRVPPSLLKHVGTQMRIAAPNIATLRSIYRRRRSTLFEHQAWAISHLGMRRLHAPADIDNLVVLLTEIVKSGLAGRQLLMAARRTLYEEHFVIPGARRLSELTRLAVSKVEAVAIAHIESAIPATTRHAWEHALADVRANGVTLLQYLQEPPGQFSPAAIETQSHKVRVLCELGVARHDAMALTPAHMHAYAQQMRRRPHARTARLKEPRRTLSLVAFMQHALCTHTDMLLRMIDRRVSQLWRRALEEARRRRGAASAAETFVSEVRRTVADVHVPVAQRLAAVQELLKQFDGGTLRPATLAANQRQMLIEYNAKIRPLIKKLLSLDLRADSGDRWNELRDAWRLAYHRGAGALTNNMCLRGSRVWSALRNSQDGDRAVYAAEAQLLWELRQALRRGSVYVPHSYAYRAPSELFDARASAIRAPLSQRDPKEFLEQLCAHLEVALENVAEALWFEELTLEGTKIRQHRLGPHDTPHELPAVRAAIRAALPLVHLPDIMVEIDSKVRFSWILLGREPASEDELLYVYVALLGHAMDVGTQRLSLMAPGLSASALTDALALLEDQPSLRRANAATLEFLQAHPLTALWGNTADCAADAMSLDATRHLWLARTDPKRRALSTATYVHTLARHGIAYDQPIPMACRQDGAAIEGALRQRVMPISRVMTDTHGYTAFGMALGKFAGIDLCPRLKSFRDRRLHIPRGNQVRVPEVLRPACVADVSLHAIVEGWPALSQIADAVVSGRLSAVLACERHGTAARGQPGYRAGHQLGLLLRTLHQCDTLSHPDFRRATLRLLNHNERTHALQRQIRRAGTRSRRGRRSEELSAQSGSLALVTNLVMAWNTHYIQGILDHWRVTDARHVDPETLVHLTPMGFEHINFDGVLAFPLAKYRSRILPSSFPSLAPDQAMA